MSGDVASILPHLAERRPPPRRRCILGNRVELVPLTLDRHRARLYDALHRPHGDPHLFDYLPYGPFEPEAWTEFLRRAERSRDPLFYAVEVGGDALGFLALLRIEPEDASIEVGHVVFGGELQRTVEATETIYLLARYALKDLAYERLEWKCDARNVRSLRAAHRLGFSFEGIFRSHMWVKDRRRDTAWFSIIRSEWPRLERSIEAWLDPANFDPLGVHHRRLEALREME